MSDIKYAVPALRALRARGERQHRSRANWPVWLAAALVASAVPPPGPRPGGIGSTSTHPRVFPIPPVREQSIRARWPKVRVERPAVQHLLVPFPSSILFSASDGRLSSFALLYGRIHACTDGGFAKALLLHVAALSTAGAFAAAAAALARRRLWGGDRRKKQLPAPAMAEMPRLQLAESGRLEYLEKFSHYVGQSSSSSSSSLPPLLRCLVDRWTSE